LGKLSLSQFLLLLVGLHGLQMRVGCLSEFDDACGRLGHSESSVRWQDAVALLKWWTANYDVTLALGVRSQIQRLRFLRCEGLSTAADSGYLSRLTFWAAKMTATFG
jgi:hypothetical protein